MIWCREEVNSGCSNEQTTVHQCVRRGFVTSQHAGSVRRMKRFLHRSHAEAERFRCMKHWACFGSFEDALTRNASVMVKLQEELQFASGQQVTLKRLHALSICAGCSWW